MWEVTAEQTRA